MAAASSASINIKKRHHPVVGKIADIKSTKTLGKQNEQSPAKKPKTNKDDKSEDKSDHKPASSSDKLPSSSDKPSPTLCAEIFATFFDWLPGQDGDDWWVQRLVDESNEEALKAAITAFTKGAYTSETKPHQFADHLSEDERNELKKKVYIAFFDWYTNEYDGDDGWNELLSNDALCDALSCGLKEQTWGKYEWVDKHPCEFAPCDKHATCDDCNGCDEHCIPSCKNHKVKCIKCHKVIDGVSGLNNPNACQCMCEHTDCESYLIHSSCFKCRRCGDDHPCICNGGGDEENGEKNDDDKQSDDGKQSDDKQSDSKQDKPSDKQPRRKPVKSDKTKQSSSSSSSSSSTSSSSSSSSSSSNNQ
jgi:hypothetical protein